VIKTLAAICEDIKIQHTVFAMPFAIMSAFMAADGTPTLRVLGLITLAMVFARSAAMAFNRIADAKFDVKNPRTMGRAIPIKLVSQKDYIIFLVVCSLGFIVVCGAINNLAFILAPLALAIVFFYSYTKRFTHHSHFFLGMALALAPLGAWVAVKEELTYQPLILGLAVIFWLAGLDIIYSCQDFDFDRQTDLKSIPKTFGIKNALTLAAMFHAVMIALLLVLAVVSPLSWVYLTGVAFTALMLLYEHSLVKPDDLTKVNVAFFNVNGVISVGLMFFTIADILISS